jgi:hypothetical protein
LLKTEQKTIKTVFCKRKKQKKQLFSPQPHAAHGLPVARGALCGGYFLPLASSARLKHGPRPVWPALALAARCEPSD